MCDIFPFVSNCCIIFSLRIGMLLISILAIMTGVIGLSAMEQKSNIDFSGVQNTTHIHKPEDAVDKISLLVSSGISAMSCIFMVAGLCLLFGTLTDNEGIIQLFVWLTFGNTLFGFIVVLVVGFECLVAKSCLLSDMDWLSGSALLVIIVAYLFYKNHGVLKYHMTFRHTISFGGIVMPSHLPFQGIIFFCCGKFNLISCIF